MWFVFQEMAKSCLKRDLCEKGRFRSWQAEPEFYIQALLYDIDFTEQEEDTALREHYAQIAKEQGNEVLHEMLKKVDPASAAIIHANNVKRTIRALEYFAKNRRTDLQTQ